MQSKFWQIMLFYAILSCFIAPGVGYFFMRSNKGLEVGYLLGTALSLLLWFRVGRKMVM